MRESTEQQIADVIDTLQGINLNDIEVSSYELSASNGWSELEVTELETWAVDQQIDDAVSTLQGILKDTREPEITAETVWNVFAQCVDFIKANSRTRGDVDRVVADRDNLRQKNDTQAQTIKDMAATISAQTVEIDRLNAAQTLDAAEVAKLDS